MGLRDASASKNYLFWQWLPIWEDSVRVNHLFEGISSLSPYHFQTQEWALICSPLIKFLIKWDIVTVFIKGLLSIGTTWSVHTKGRQKLMGEASLQCLVTVCKKVERWPAVFECTLLPPSSSLKSLVSGKAFACLVMGFIAPETKKHITITKQ